MLTPWRLVKICHNVPEDLHLQHCSKDLSYDKHCLLSVGLYINYQLDALIIIYS